jgi:hypothetical protein
MGNLFTFMRDSTGVEIDYSLIEPATLPGVSRSYECFASMNVLADFIMLR